MNCTHIRRLALLVVLAAAFLMPAVAQDGTTVQSDQVPPLWRTEDADTTVYLLGTIHLMTEGVTWFKGPVREAFDGADTLVVELNQNKVSRQTQQQLVREVAVLPQSEKLSSAISDDTMSQLTSLLEPMGVPRSAINRWKPWYAGLTVTTVLAQQAGFLPQYGVDVTLLQEAQQRGTDVRELEDFETQLELFDELNRDDALYMLRDALEEQGEIKDLFRDLRDAWLSRDFATLEEILLESREENPEFFGKVFVDRNRRWADALESLMEAEAGTIFLAVGVGHLIGDRSLITMLEERGYEVELR
jgi:hypothetical protein